MLEKLKCKTILIAGSGQNSGKTSFAERLISYLKGDLKVVALKVTSHFYPPTKGLIQIVQKKGLSVAEETDESSTKDSSRFLRAGAIKSFYAQVEDDKVNDLINWLKLTISDSSTLIIESALIGQKIVPDKAFFLTSEREYKNPSWQFEYIVVEDFLSDSKTKFESIFKNNL